MIGEYYRPASIEEAIALLIDKQKALRPMGGGTSLSRQQAGQFGVVDLQNVGLDRIEKRGQHITSGAMVRLGDLVVHPDIHPEIQRAIKIDANENSRNAATLGGWLVSGDGRSILTTVLLALDASLVWEPGKKQVTLGDWLPMRDQEAPGVLITGVEWALGPYLAYDYVARSPKDRPILIVAAAQWRSGRTRIALGGFGESPIIAMDGPGGNGADIASRDAYYKAEDQWATALYRREVAATLALRCLERINLLKKSEA